MALTVPPTQSHPTGERKCKQERVLEHEERIRDLATAAISIGSSCYVCDLTPQAHVESCITRAYVAAVSSVTHGLQ